MKLAEIISLTEQAQDPGYYTIGDSHAVAIAQMGGAGWHNLAVGGAPSRGSHPFVQKMLAGIGQIPQGSVVVVSLGANDTANAYRAAKENGRKARDPSDIAQDVAGVVEQVQARSPRLVVFMLFPNGPGYNPGNKDAVWYGSQYQDSVRAAIKSAVHVPIIDINGRQLSDGVHAVPAVYKDVAQEVMAMAKNKPQIKPVEKPQEKAKPQAGQKDRPFPGRPR